MHWVSVGFYEMGDIQKKDFILKKSNYLSAQFPYKLMVYGVGDTLNSRCSG